MSSKKILRAIEEHFSRREMGREILYGVLLFWHVSSEKKTHFAGYSKWNFNFCGLAKPGNVFLIREKIFSNLYGVHEQNFFHFTWNWILSFYVENRLNDNHWRRFIVHSLSLHWTHSEISVFLRVYLSAIFGEQLRIWFWYRQQSCK